METPNEQIGVWRLVREGDGFQLQTYYPSEKRWMYVRLSRNELFQLKCAMDEELAK
jgi:hypothetical protein